MSEKSEKMCSHHSFSMNWKSRIFFFCQMTSPERKGGFFLTEPEVVLKSYMEAVEIYVFSQIPSGKCELWRSFTLRCSKTSLIVSIPFTHVIYMWVTDCSLSVMIATDSCIFLEAVDSLKNTECMIFSLYHYILLCGLYKENFHYNTVLIIRIRVNYKIFSHFKINAILHLNLPVLKQLFWGWGINT